MSTEVATSGWRKAARSLYRKVSWGGVAVFLVLGILYAFVLPPFQAPDEETHWRLANARFQVLRGRDPECSIAYSLPRHLGSLEIQLRSNERIRTGRFATLKDAKSSCEGDTRYAGSLWNYPGAILALILTQHSRTDPRAALFAFYLARLLQGLLVTTALYRCVRFLNRAHAPPWGALTVVALALSPIFIQQSFVVSSDGIFFAFCLSALAVCLGWPQVTFVDLALFIVTGYGSATIKPILAPIALGVLALMIGIGMLSSRRDEVRGFRETLHTSLSRPYFKAFAAVAIGVSSYAVIFMLRFAASTEEGKVPPDVDTAYNLSLMTSGALVGLKVVFATLWSYMDVHRFSERVGYLDTTLASRTRFLHLYLFQAASAVDLVCLLAAIRLAWRQHRSSWSSALFMGGGFLIAEGGVFAAAFGSVLSMYLYWTPKYAAESAVHGVQARYFAGLAILSIGVLVAALRGAAFGRSDEPAVSVPAVGPGGRFVVSAGMSFMTAWAAAYGINLMIDLAQRYW